MNVLLFGATGMVGQGVLRECLLDPQVQRVQTVGRTATGARHSKLREIVHPDLWHYATIEPDLSSRHVSSASVCRTDSSENGRIMWARVKGQTENALSRLPFAAAYMFRPGMIEPLHGIKSKTASYRVLYTLTKPLLPWIRAAFPDHVLTTEQIGRAM